VSVFRLRERRSVERESGEQEREESELKRPATREEKHENSGQSERADRVR